jgi:gliding motility-associated-like protein
VTSAEGCTSLGSANIVINSQPATPAAPAIGTITQPNCATATGSVVLNGLPATGTWTLTGTPGGVIMTGTGTTATVSALTAGTYTFKVTNAVGCSSVASPKVVINVQPATPAAPVVGAITQPTCAISTGKVVLSGLPATGIWTLTRSPGGVTTTGAGTGITVSALAAGTYTFTVTNTAGCTSVPSANAVINIQPATPAAPIVETIIQPTCSLATGSVVLNGLPESGTWTLIRTPGGVTTTGTGTTTTISALAARTYTFKVTNADGCTSVASANVVINVQPATPAAPIVGMITQPTCSLSTGSIFFYGLPVSGTWTLTRMPGGITTTGTGTSITISAPAAGSYTYTVTNAAGCTSAASANLEIKTQPATPPAPAVGTITQPTCAIATGSVVLNGLPASGLWTLTRTSDGATTTGTGTSTTISGLITGTYSYTVSNPDGCTSAASANVVIGAQPSTPTAPVIGIRTQPTCAVATGSVVLSGLPVSGTWTLTRTPGSVTTTGTGTSTTISTLVAGNYTYTVTNSDGCTSAVSAPVVINTQPTSPAVPLIGTVNQPTCSIATGSVVLNGLPATEGWTLTRTPGGITTTGTGTSTTISALVAGTYTYAVTNSDGCTSGPSASVVINVQPETPAAPSIGLITQPVCSVSTGTITVTAPTGTGVSYSLDGVTYSNTNGIFTQVPSGTYQVTAKNTNGCISAGTIVTIKSAPPVLTLTKAEVTSPILCNGGTATVTLISSGGTAPISYTLNGVKNYTGIFNGVLAASSITYSITDANQCGPLSGVINVTQPEPLGLNANAVNVTCKGAANGSINLTVSNGKAPYSYKWTGPGTFAATTEDLSALSGGTYNVLVTDDNGCSKTTSVKVEESTDVLNVTATSKNATNTLSINGETELGATAGSITLTVSGGTAAYTYLWTGPNGFTAITKDITDLAKGVYKVTVTDAYGCSTTISVEILVQVVLSEDENCVVLVPNSFSPNADGINDKFKVNCLYNYENPIIEIYNRWGNIVFKKDHYGDVDFWGSEESAWWNGRSDNKLTIGSQELPVGTYYYILKLTNKKVLTGFLFLNK